MGGQLELIGTSSVPALDAGTQENEAPGEAYFENTVKLMNGQFNGRAHGSNFIVPGVEGIDYPTGIEAEVELVITSPVMTGYTTPSGEVLRSYDSGSFPAWWCFDGTEGYNGRATFTEGPTGVLGYTHTEPAAVVKYVLTQTADAVVDRMPVDWTLEGSVLGDFTDAVTLDTVTGATWAAGEVDIKEYNISNTQAYLSYRINVTANTGSEAFTQLSQLAFYKEVV